jgi:hypothetical protein
MNIFAQDDNGLSRLLRCDNNGNLYINTDINNITIGGNIDIANFPEIQQVSGNIDILNFPEIQQISGNVNVEFPDSININGNVDILNFPEIQQVSGNVDILNFPEIQQVSGNIDILNFPEIQQISGNVNVEFPDSININGNVDILNFPEIQQISGNVNISTLPSISGNVAITNNSLNVQDDIQRATLESINSNIILINNKINNSNLVSYSTTETLQNVKCMGYYSNEEKWATLNVNSVGKLMVEADLTESEIVLNTYDEALNSNVSLINSNIGLMNDKLTLIETYLKYDYDWDLRRLRGAGKCFSVCNNTNTTNNNFLYINCPVDHPFKFYVYNIQFSVRPATGTVGFLSVRLTQQPYVTSGATALKVINLRSNESAGEQNVSICGTGGSVIQEGELIMTLTTNGAAQSQTIDLQEERIEISQGTSIYFQYGTLGSTAVTDMSVRFHRD